MQTKKIYVGVCTVFAISALLYFFLPDTTFFQTLAAVPMVGALLGALFVLIRDYAAHERTQQLQDAKNYFLLGASSHMANVAFDKHAKFAEEYVAEAHSALVKLFQEGPTSEALDHATTLYGIQKTYRVWLTEEIEERLDRFEGALRKVGAGARYEERTTGKAHNEERIKALYRSFAEIVGLEEWEGGTITDDNAVVTLIRWLRDILGTEELTELRRTIIANAARSAGKASGERM